jgi:hypothetical protein
MCFISIVVPAIVALIYILKLCAVPVLLETVAKPWPEKV